NQEPVISPGFIIEGKSEGMGHGRISRRFMGDVRIDGVVTIEQGAHITGCIWAENMMIRGELEGNIHAASWVELTGFFEHMTDSPGTKA
ncbi:MAG: polymer-forming cytoskeletal protein, partial [Candidatus Binatia bacterium]